MRACSHLPAPFLRVAGTEYLTRLGRSLARSVRRLCRRLRVLTTRSQSAAHAGLTGFARFGRGGERGPRVCVPVGSARARIVLRFDTFVVLVTVVGTFSVSKLAVMDTVCIDGEGSRV